MDTLSWLLAFSQITFPVFLLIPTLITAFKTTILPEELDRLFSLLWLYYAVIVIATYVWTKREWYDLVLISLPIIIIAAALFYVARWTLQEQVTNLLDYFDDEEDD